ncbi:MAG: hypothetical protein AAGA85_00485 [Bacteroidota bacterium]
MKRLAYTFILSFGVAILSSCVDDEKLFELDDFETGALANMQRTTNDLGFIDSFNFDTTPIEFTVDFTIDAAQSGDGGLTNGGDGRITTNTEFRPVASVDVVVSYLNSQTGATDIGVLNNFTSWPATVSLTGVGELVDAIPSIGSSDDINVGDVFNFVCGINFQDGTSLPAFVQDASGTHFPNYSVNYSGGTNNPGFDYQVTYNVSCSSNLIPEGTRTYDLVTNITGTCCGLPTGPQQTGRTATITDLGSGTYEVSDILAGHIAPFNIDPEPIRILDVCATYSLANAGSVLVYTGAGSAVSLDEATGVWTIAFNNEGNAIVGVATLTPQ